MEYDIDFFVVVAKSCSTLVTPWTVACQAPLSKGFFRQEYFSGLPFPSPGDLPDSGIEPMSPALQTDSLPTKLRGKPMTLGLKAMPNDQWEQKYWNII